MRDELKTRKVKVNTKVDEPRISVWGCLGPSDENRDFRDATFHILNAKTNLPPYQTRQRRRTGLYNIGMSNHFSKDFFKIKIEKTIQSDHPAEMITSELVDSIP